MAKYKVGDRVLIVNHRTRRMDVFGDMDKWFGKTMTIRRILPLGYFMVEDREENCCEGWYWDDEMIAGLAEPEKPADENLSVAIQFHGRLTVAELVKGGKVVKTAKAQCNPADTYSRSEGARIAVERLFEKKRPVANDDEIKKAIAAGVAEAHKKGHRGKIGDKFVVIGNDPGLETHHFFEIGEIVTLAEFSRPSSRYVNRYGMRQWVRDEDVRPYKEGKA